MRARCFVLMLVTVAGACGDSSVPRNPSPTAPPAPGPATWSIGGTVTDALTGQRVPGATLTFSGLPAATTDGDGLWQIQGTGASPGTPVLTAAIEAPGFIERETRIEWRTGGRSDVTLSLFPDRAPFSLAFFRQLVRNGLEAPGFLEPLRRWDENANFYLNAHNPRTDQKLLASEVEMIEATIRSVIPQVTGGRLSAGVIEVGTVARALRPGVINIDIIHDPGVDFCGESYIGSNPGRIRLNYDRCRVAWCNEGISPNVLAHEIGHAMGFWHVPEGVMIATLDDCKGTTFSEEERVHAGLAYQRPAGNRDMDKDPASFRAATADDAPRITCRRVLRP